MMRSPDLVVLAGLPGVGKSTVARALAARTGALWLRVDLIEQAMRESHMRWTDLADGGYAAMRAAAEGALTQGHAVIADAVHPVEVTRAPWEEVAARCGARLWPVELVCLDGDVHRHRVETRVAEVPGASLPDWAAVQARVYVPWTGALQIDTGDVSVEAAVSLIGAQMERNG